MPESELMQTLADMNEQAKNSQANQGLGSLGWWPDEGTHDCWVDPDVEMVKGVFAYGRGQDRKEIPCTNVRFRYHLLNDPGSEEPRSFWGQWFNLLKDSQVKSLPESREAGGLQQTRARISTERFKGHLTTILGEEPSNFQTGLQQTMKKLAKITEGKGILHVKVRCDYTESTRKGSTDTYRRPDVEFLQPA